MKTAWRFRIPVTHVYLMPITPFITLVSDFGAYKLGYIWVIGTITSGLQLTLNLQAVSLKGCSVVLHDNSGRVMNSVKLNWSLNLGP